VGIDAAIVAHHHACVWQVYPDGRVSTERVPPTLSGLAKGPDPYSQEWDLHIFLGWCIEHGIDPLAWRWVFLHQPRWKVNLVVLRVVQHYLVAPCNLD
jgi:hypothetical protein